MQPPIDPERIAESTARHLLERATALDVDGPTLAQLRQAAVEAGISPAAFDAAVAEWRAAASVTASPMPVNWTERVVRNTTGLALGWLSVAGLAAAQRMLDAPWLVHKVSDPVGLVLGAFIATRLRARTASIVLGGLAVAQGAEVLLDIAAGAPAIHGVAAHIALMITGVGGVAIGRAVWGRSTRSSGDQQPPGDAASIEAAASGAASRGVGLTGAAADKGSLLNVRPVGRTLVGILCS